jgi:hypothetical protein
MIYRVTVIDEFGKRLLWGKYRSHKKARCETTLARKNCYPTRVTKIRVKQ